MRQAGIVLLSLIAAFCGIVILSPHHPDPLPDAFPVCFTLAVGFLTLTINARAERASRPGAADSQAAPAPRSDARSRP